MDELKIFIGTVFVVVGLVFGLLKIVQFQQEYACEKFGNITKREVKYAPWTGCFAREEGGKFRYWQEFVTEKGGY